MASNLIYVVLAQDGAEQPRLLSAAVEQRSATHPIRKSQIVVDHLLPLGHRMPGIDNHRPTPAAAQINSGRQAGDAASDDRAVPDRLRARVLHSAFPVFAGSRYTCK